MIIFVSQDGYVKRMPLKVEKMQRGSTGKTLNTSWFKILREPEGDYDIVILTNLGGIIRFPLSELRPMGERAQGVRAIRLQPYENVQDAIIIGSEEE